MIARAGSGWQTVLADLSLILFMATAAALSQAGGDDAVAVSSQAEPLALYRAGTGAPPLGAWLAAQSGDTRQALTIVVQYPPGGREAALAQARALATDADPSGLAVRIVVEPGAGGTSASLAYDDPRATLARPLLDPERTASHRKDER